MLIKDVLSPCSVLLLICVFSISGDATETTITIPIEANPTTATVQASTSITTTDSAAANTTTAPVTGDNSTSSSPPEAVSGVTTENTTDSSGAEGTTQAPTFCHKCMGRDCNDKPTSANMTCESTKNVCWTVVDKSDSSNHTTNRTCDTPNDASCNASDDCKCAGNIVACCCIGDKCNTKKSSELGCKSGSPGATSFSSALLTVSLMVLSTYQAL
ncbi:unnamed protein product [Owenia fusiformis]|uniref:Uncharacterized protein n=1 Tax=Owenia fusiformis TaxID=6347 RepID=A0A8J1XTY4_OWEFU|nr:unnamed protein product [Owenia fusiformis]